MVVTHMCWCGNHISRESLEVDWNSYDLLSLSKKNQNNGENTRLIFKEDFVRGCNNQTKGIKLN